MVERLTEGMVLNLHTSDSIDPITRHETNPHTEKEVVTEVKKDFDSWLSTENQEGWYIKNILNWKTTVDTGSVYCAVLMERETKR